ncbi:SAM-dependent methyltransferase, partial [Clavibacter michiganensis]|uniref:SAM-dependent methyltransferase n=1 Tax=Clavibacter michiganensis TaxID=28447 RepID=UPI00292F5130
IYDYILGGKDYYPADREAGDAMARDWPALPVHTRANRDWMNRAVRWLAEEAGIRQFLDIGTGIPTEPNLHQIVQAISPAARIVYADNDPIVLRHAEALLTGTPEGVTDFLHADVRQPATILERAREVLDFDRPIALSLIALLHFLPDDEDPYRVVSTLVDTLPRGSYLL